VSLAITNAKLKSETESRIGALQAQLADNISPSQFELLTRYSGVNQRAIVADEISTTPALGFSGSPAIFLPHAH
jgi:hypothetical protein